MAELHYHLVTPEKLYASGEAEMLVVPGVIGDFGVMCDHVPFVSMVRAGIIEIHRENAVDERIFISDGYAETHGDQCTILAETLVNVRDLDAAVLEKERDDARFALEHANDTSAQEKAQAAIALINAKLAAIA